MIRERTDRWNGAIVGTLALLSIGLLYAEPTLLVAALIPLVYVFYESVSTTPSEATLSIERSVEQAAVLPGEIVDVELTVRNNGDRVLSDVRIIDRVPNPLAVTTGTPRVCGALAPGDEVSTSYSLLVKRGDYYFNDPLVRVRSLAASEQLTATIETQGNHKVSGRQTVRDPPLTDVTLPRAGTHPTDSGGSGLEFYATRQYRRGDPMNRIDWRHAAKTGEFITIQYREEQATRIVIIIDGRRAGRSTAAPGYPTGSELAAYVGNRLYNSLRDLGVVTSVAAVGVSSERIDQLAGPDGLPWIDPEQDTGTDELVQSLFSEVQQSVQEDSAPLSTDPPSSEEQLAETVQADGGTVSTASSSMTVAQSNIDQILARLHPNSQVVLCSPVLDDWAINFTEALTAQGYSQTLVSPDVTAGDLLGQRVAALHRDVRLSLCEQAGANVVSWNVEQSIDYALRRSLPYLIS